MNVRLISYFLLVVIFSYNLVTAWSTLPYCPSNKNPLMGKNEFYSIQITLPEKSNKKFLRSIWQIDLARPAEKILYLYKNLLLKKENFNLYGSTKLSQLNFSHTGISPPRNF